MSIFKKYLGLMSEIKNDPFDVPTIDEFNTLQNHNRSCLIPLEKPGPMSKPYTNEHMEQDIKDAQFHFTQMKEKLTRIVENRDDITIQVNSKTIHPDELTITIEETRNWEFQ
jgi:hypothetical protein